MPEHPVPSVETKRPVVHQSTAHHPSAALFLPVALAVVAIGLTVHPPFERGAASRWAAFLLYVTAGVLVLVLISSLSLLVEVGAGLAVILSAVAWKFFGLTIRSPVVRGRDETAPGLVESHIEAGMPAQQSGLAVVVVPPGGEEQAAKLIQQLGENTTGSLGGE